MPFELAYFIISVVTLIIVGYLFYGKYLFKRKKDNKKGKVVLLDFWTYCCINCMHIIPDLKKLETKYSKELVVTGVHSAKFQNEREAENIRQAILRYEIEHPVINDSNFAIWQAYRASAWPTLVLIDPEGNIVGSDTGEGHYEILDKLIGKLVSGFRSKNLINEKPIPLSLEKY